MKNDKIKTFEISPSKFGFDIASPADLKGGTVSDNARILTAVLEGKRGPAKDVVVMNSALALAVGDLVDDLHSGVNLAEEIIDSGRALTALEKLREVSNS